MIPVGSWRSSPATPDRGDEAPCSLKEHAWRSRLSQFYRECQADGPTVEVEIARHKYGTPSPVMDPLLANIITAVLSSVLAGLGAYAAIRVAERKKAEDDARQNCIVHVIECLREARHLAGYLMQRDVGGTPTREWVERYRNCWSQFNVAVAQLEKLLVAASGVNNARVRKRTRIGSWLGLTSDDVREVWGWLPKAFYGVVPPPDMARYTPSTENHDVDGLREIEKEIQRLLPAMGGEGLPAAIQQLCDEKERAWMMAMATAEDNAYKDLIEALGNRDAFISLLASRIAIDGAESIIARLVLDLESLKPDLLWLSVAILDVADSSSAPLPVFEKLCDLVAAAYEQVPSEHRTSWVSNIACKARGPTGLIGILERAESMSMPETECDILRSAVLKHLERAKLHGNEVSHKTQALRILNWWHSEDSASAAKWAVDQILKHPRDAYDFLRIFLAPSVDSRGNEQYSFDLHSASQFMSGAALSRAVEDMAFGPLSVESRPLLLALRAATLPAASSQPLTDGPHLGDDGVGSG